MEVTETTGARPTIGLAMIVKDEVAVIERCLASALPLVDTWTIVDTGSTDGTQELVRALLADVPGTLHERPWRDFGANRSELMDLARDTADYLLLVDADMTVRVTDELPTLTADAYLLLHAGSLSYRIPRLVRGDLPWRYVGATHEYLACDAPASDQQALDALVIEHHADGGSRADKFERDRRLLERAVAEDADDERSTFYLAQTYADLGEVDLALAAYRRRVELGGWEEETFVAQLRVGELLAARDWPAAVPELLAAWELRPSRAEPLYRLAQGYRARDQHWLAAVFARTGSAIPYPDDDLLFVDREPYDWGLRFERSISAYWSGHPDESLTCSEELLDGRAPDWLLPWVHHNRQSARVCAGPDGPAPRTASDPHPASAGSPRSNRPPGCWASSSRAPASSCSPRPKTTPTRDGRCSTRASRREMVATCSCSATPTTSGSTTATTKSSMAMHGSAPATGSARSTPPGRCSRSAASSSSRRARRPSSRTSSASRTCARSGSVPAGWRWAPAATATSRHAARSGCGTWGPTPPGSGPLGSSNRPKRSSTRRTGCPSWSTACCTWSTRATPWWCSRSISTRRRSPRWRAPPVPNRPATSVAGRRGSRSHPTAGSSWRTRPATAPTRGRTYVHRFLSVTATRDEQDGPASGFELSGVSSRFTFTGAKIEFCAGATIDGDDLVCAFGRNDAQALLVRMPLAEALGLIDDVSSDPPPT